MRRETRILKPLEDIPPKGGEEMEEYTILESREKDADGKMDDTLHDIECKALLATMTIARNRFAKAIDKYKHRYSARHLNRIVMADLAFRSLWELEDVVPD